MLVLVTWILLHGLVQLRYNQYAGFGGPAFLDADSLVDDGGQIGYYGFLQSESAFHFRTTLMFAVDEYQPPKLLLHDDWQQYPEGVNSWKEYGLFMEPIYGYAFRVLGGFRLSLIDFLLWWIPAIHALTVLGVFCVARQLQVEFRYAFLGAIFYASCPLPFHAILTAFYVKETFSLFLLAWFFVAHFAAIRRNSVGLVVVSAVLLTLFLLSWHLAQFLAAVVITGSLFAAVESRSALQLNARNVYYLMPLAYVAAGLASGTSPFLAARHFALSPTMAPSYAWLVFVAVIAKIPRLMQRHVSYRYLIAIAIVTVLFVLFAKFNGNSDYSHVYRLFTEQIAHGFRKPSDPNDLPFAVRLFWMKPFTPPDVPTYWMQSGLIGAILAGSLIGVAIAAIRRRVILGSMHGQYVALCLFAVWMLSERLGPVCWLMAPTILGVAARSFERSIRLIASRYSVRISIITVVLAVVSLVHVATTVLPLASASVRTLAGEKIVLRGLDASEPADRASLFRWISENTAGPGSMLPGGPDVFAADIALSPALLLYSGRPVVLNSQFENEKIRRRTEVWLQALFSNDGERIRNFCNNLGVNYLVVDRDLATTRGRKTMRYMAGSASLPDTSCLAGKMHFQPRSINGLSPVYDNGHYRVFKIGESGNDGGRWTKGYGRWWNPMNYDIRGGVLVQSATDRDILQKIDVRMDEIGEELDELAERIMLERNRSGSESDAPLLALRKSEVDVLVASRIGGRVPEIPEEGERAIDRWLGMIDPASGNTLQQELNRILDGDGDGSTGLLGILQARVPEPSDERTAGELCVLAGRYADAARCYAGLADLVLQQTSGWTPDDGAELEEAVRSLVLAVRWSVAAGDMGTAAVTARRAMTLGVLDPKAQAFLEQICRVALDR